MAVPSTTEGVTTALLTEVLRRDGALAPGAAVVAVAHERIARGVGILGQLARLRLTYDGPAPAAPASVILKLPTEAPDLRAVAAHFGFYERESRFYDELAATVPVRTPHCYWNHREPGTGSHALLLEDLGGLTQVDQLTGLGADRAATAVDALGRLHGSWWSSPRLDALTWSPRLSDPLVLSAGQSYRDSWPLFCERLGDAVPAGGLALGERIGARWEEVTLETGSRAPTTVCHGDYRADNLLFDDDPRSGDPVAVLDWQVTMRGPGIADVAYLLAQSLTAEDRRAHERALLRRWHAGVAATVRRPLDEHPLELAWDQYRAATLGTTVYPVVGGASVDLTDDRARALARCMTERAFTAALDHDAAGFL